MIQTRSSGITPEQIRCIRVQPDETLLVQVAVGTMPPSRIHEYLENVRKYLLSSLPEDTRLIVTTDQITFSVVSQP